jgi:uncharacterized protein involved in response to NO
MVTALDPCVSSAVNRSIVHREHNRSVLLRAWIVAGLFFMALPGTLLGFSNLMAISVHHGARGLPPAWMEGHGHAQMFGWIGSFILGIGFYSQPASRRSAVAAQWCSFGLWVAGVALRWTANLYGWHWRVLLPVSAGLELTAVLLFLAASSQHKRAPVQGKQQTRAPIEQWMVSVLLGSVGLVATAAFNFGECLNLAVTGPSPSFPHWVDQRYLLLAGWGFIVPVVWGFSARWLPIFLGRQQPKKPLFGSALLLDAAGVLAGTALGLNRISTLLLVAAAVLSGVALVLRPPRSAHPKVLGVHPTFPFFARLTYLWLGIAGTMSVWAAFADQHGGIWGASRHALTVGFAATMVFAIGPRILPHFAGVNRIFSTRMMFSSLLLLQLGCTLRVTCEPLAYEGFLTWAWKVLPVSGMFELAAVVIFAANLVLTFVFGKTIFAAANLKQART